MEAPLQKLLHSVAAADDLETLARPILELLEAVTGLESTYLTTIDHVAGVQRILFARNTRKMQIPEGLSVPWGDTLCKRALDEGKAYTDNVGDCWGDSQAARELGIKTYLSQPVRMLEDEVYGTLCAASAESVPLKPDTIEVLAKFARLIAQQVEREKALLQMRAANLELSAHALADPLTGLGNRRAMERALARLSAQRVIEPMVVAFVDLDGFKAINDRYGHETGDRFLVHIARKLTAAVRPTDSVCRTGGDEFVILAPGASAPELASRLEEATGGHFAHGPCAFDYGGASVGVAESKAGQLDAEELLKRADAAMYEVKKSRNSRRVAMEPRSAVRP
jgi:diguanylate cyclase